MALRTERVLFVHAHPEDIAAGTGAAIATLVNAGARVTVVTSARNRSGVTPDEALRVLGVTDHRYLGDENARWPGQPVRSYTGSHWGSRSPALAGTGVDDLVAADAGEVAADIAAVIDDVVPRAVVSYGEHDSDADHRHVYEAARRAAEVMGVAYFAISSPAELGRRDVVVDDSAALERKRNAIRAQAAATRAAGLPEQDAPDAPEAPGEPEVPAERFVRVRAVPRGARIAARVAGSLLALLVGFLAGCVLTVTHQASVVVFGFPLPLGLIAAIAFSAGLLAGLRLVYDSRLIAGAASAGLLMAVAILSLQSTGGSILGPGNVAGYTWAFAPVVIAFVVLAWPRLRPARAN